MNTKDWKLLKHFNQLNVALDGPWLRIADYISKGKVVKCTASGAWRYLPEHAQHCDADGFLGLPLPCDQLLVPSSPLGSLIGKLGGSSADQKDGTIFAIGRFTMLTVPDKEPCALFVTVNSMKGARIGALERLDLKVEIADA